MKNLINEKVSHKKFGKGVIVQHKGRTISVQFGNEIGLKNFDYPSCFESYLTFVDSTAAIKMANEIKQQKDKEIKDEQQFLLRLSAQKSSYQRYGSIPEIHTDANFLPFDSVIDFCRNYKQSLTKEMEYQKTHGSKRHRLFDGNRIERKNEFYIYTFEADDELNYPEGTATRIWVNHNTSNGYIIGCEDFTVIMAINNDLGNTISSVEFAAESWQLLQALIDCLEHMPETPTKIVHAIISDGLKAITDNPMKLGQEKAVSMSKKQPITFIWGPPGTGKTQTLAKIASDHIQQGNRVLMLSYSNVSVDGAVIRVHQIMSHSKPGTLIRYGYARQKYLLMHEYLTSYKLAIHKHPDLYKEYKELTTERKKLPRNSQRYVEIERQLIRIKNTLSSEEKDIVRKANFVSTTVSKALIDSTINKSKFDIVIFDEASMAYVPHIVFAASLAQKHFICLGDFRQLPPIVQSHNNSLLNIDIFQYCGITSAVANKKNHQWLCLLDTQYRMHPFIADFASHMMYEGLLRSADEMDSKRSSIVSKNPIPGQAMVLADLTGMMSVCNKTGDHSRINVLSAMIAFSLATEAAKTCQVGIITPYHAQSRLFHAMVKDATIKNFNSKGISCATVHQFQGSEKDVIIYDAVDCYRMSYPGKLLTSTENDYANRLFNVALTRAKGKFISIANISYLENKNFSHNLMFARLIKLLKNTPCYITGKQLLLHRNFSHDDNLIHFFGSPEAEQYFLRDIKNAQHEIRIDIPNKAVEDTLSSQLMIALQNAKVKGIRIHLRTENKQSLPSQLKKLAIENPYVYNPLVIIDKKITWFGMPHSDANFQSENTVLFTKYHPIIRFDGKHTATSLYGYMEMNQTIDQNVTDNNEEQDSFANYVSSHTQCPVCGRPMRLKKSKQGKFFLACTGFPDCKKTTLIDKDLVEEYLYRNGGTGQHCVQCGCSLEAKIGPYGIYIQCCGLPVHRYRIDEI